MARTQQKKRANSDKQKRRLDFIETAIGVLTTKSLSGFSARSIADAGSMTKSALHYYFSDMDELLDEAEIEIAKRYTERIRSISRRHETPIARFWAAVDAYFESFEDNLPMASHWFEYWVYATQKGRSDKVERIMVGLASLFAELLSDAGVPDAERRAQYLLSYFVGAVMRGLTLPGFKPADHTIIASICGLEYVQRPAVGEAGIDAEVTWTAGDPRRLELGAKYLVVEESNSVATITFNNPAKLNTVTKGDTELLSKAVVALGNDEAIRVIVLRGSGDRAFSSGGDLNELLSVGAAAFSRDMEDKNGFEELCRVKVPTIAQIQGRCFGGGVMYATTADLRIAATNATFCVPTASVGTAYPVQATQRLRNLIGEANAAKMLFTGMVIDAETALEYGLINEIVEPNQLSDRVKELCELICAKAPLSLQSTKLALRAQDGNSIEQARKAFHKAWQSEDAGRGIKAAVEKRMPRFDGT